MSDDLRDQIAAVLHHQRCGCLPAVSAHGENHWQVYRENADAVLGVVGPHLTALREAVALARDERSGAREDRLAAEAERDAARAQVDAALALANPHAPGYAESFQALHDRVMQQRFTDDDDNDVGAMRPGHAAAAISLTLTAALRALDSAAQDAPDLAYCEGCPGEDGDCLLPECPAFNADGTAQDTPPVDRGCRWCQADPGEWCGIDCGSPSPALHPDFRDWDPEADEDLDGAAQDTERPALPSPTVEDYVRATARALGVDEAGAVAALPAAQRAATDPPGSLVGAVDAATDVAAQDTERPACCPDCGPTGCIDDAPAEPSAQGEPTTHEPR